MGQKGQIKVKHIKKQNFERSEFERPRSEYLKCICCFYLLKLNFPDATCHIYCVDQDFDIKQITASLPETSLIINTINVVVKRLKWVTNVFMSPTLLYQSCGGGDKMLCENIHVMDSWDSWMPCGEAQCFGRSDVFVPSKIVSLYQVAKTSKNLVCFCLSTIKLSP